MDLTQVQMGKAHRVLGTDNLSWDYKQEHRCAEIKLRKGDTKLLDI